MCCRSFAREGAGGRRVAAEPGVIRVIGEDVRRSWPKDRYDLAVIYDDGVGGDDLGAVTAQGDVVDEVNDAAAATGVKFDQGVGGDCAAANVERSARAEGADFDRVRGKSGIDEIDLSANGPVICDFNG